MKKTTALVLVVILLIVSLCSCSLTANQGEGELSEVEEAVTDITSYLTEEEWNEAVDANYVEQIDGVTTVTIKEWYEDYTIYASYPVIDGFDDASAEIQSFVEEKINNFEQEVQANAGKKYDVKPEFIMTYEPSVYADSTISFKFVTYSDSGEIRTNNYIDTFVYDKNSGEKIVLADMFNPESNYLEVLSQTVKSKLENNPIIQDYSGDTTLLESGTSPSEDNFKLFVIRSEEISFFFNQGEVAPAPAGSFEVVVSHEELSDVLSDNFKNGVSLLGSSSVANVELPSYLQSGEDEMPAYSIDGIDPINDKVVAMTFDDGPAPDKTMKVVEAFQSVGGKCTFFMIGENAAAYPDIVKQVYDAGMEIGNHSYDHTNYYKVSYEEMVNQIESSNDAIQAATGLRPIIFRAPYGNVTAEAAEQYGRQSVYWTVDTLDWKNRDADMNYENTINGVYDGAIVLMHDIHQETVDSIPRIVNRLTELGYKLVSISQLDQILIARGQDPTWRLGRDASTARPENLDDTAAVTETEA